MDYRRHSAHSCYRSRGAKLSELKCCGALSGRLLLGQIQVSAEYSNLCAQAARSVTNPSNAPGGLVQLFGAGFRWVPRSQGFCRADFRRQSRGQQRGIEFQRLASLVELTFGIAPSAYSNAACRESPLSESCSRHCCSSMRLSSSSGSRRSCRCWSSADLIVAPKSPTSPREHCHIRIFGCLVMGL